MSQISLHIDMLDIFPYSEFVLSLHCLIEIPPQWNPGHNLYLFAMSACCTIVRFKNEMFGIKDGAVVDPNEFVVEVNIFGMSAN